MTRDDIIALFKRRDDAWQRRDTTALAADHTESAVGESPMQGRLVGRDHIRKVYDIWVSAFPDLSFTSEALIIDGARVAQFFTVRGTQKGQFSGVAPTGRRFEIHGAWLYELDEHGQIAHDRRVYDVTNMLVQLGALRTKPAN